MTTRLDRLFVLLASTGSAGTRQLAARQLGQLAKTRPEELPVLLEKLHPYLRHSQWETRTAAVLALEHMLVVEGDEFREDDTDSGPSLTEFKRERVLLKFETFDLQSVLAAVEEQPPDEDSVGPLPDVSKQREELHKRLGLDVAAKLGVDTEQIVSREDLGAASRTSR